MRALRGDGRGLASACEDQVGGWGLIKESWLDFRQRRVSRQICTTENDMRNHRWTQMDYERTQIARMTRMHADTKSVRLIFICEISFPWDAPHIYNLLYIYIRALNIPPNSYKVSRSDPALIEDTGSTTCAIFAVMVVVLEVPAPARISWGVWVWFCWR